MDVVGDTEDPEGKKEPLVSRPVAVAHSRVTMQSTTLDLVRANEIQKGDVLATARFAGVRAVTHAASLLPSTSPANFDRVTIDFELSDTHIDVVAKVTSRVQAPVPGQALAAASVAALTIYDMCKSADRTMAISDVTLVPSSREAD